MRSTLAGFAIGCVMVVLALAIGSHSNDAYADPQLRQFASSREGIEVFQSSDGQQLTLVDRHRQVMAVYAIDSKTNEIMMRSVRNFRWDLEMEVFNGTDPEPQQIRALVESR